MPYLLHYGNFNYQNHKTILMKKKILMPTDFSDNSWNAIVYALKLYSDISCTFYLLNSHELYVSTTINLTNRLAKTIKENSIKELKELRSQMQSSNINPEHDFQIISSAKNLMTAIENAVITYSIDLVVMGTKGATGAKEFLFGSNTVKTIKSMTLCPVLIIPEDFEFTEPKQIAFPTDFNHFYGHIVLKSIKELAKLYNCNVSIIHINVEEKLDDIQTYNMDMLKTYFEDIEHSFHWMPNFTKKAKAINIFIEDLDIDLLVMISYSHTFIESITKEPVINKMGFHPKIPFLVIPSLN